MTTEFARPERVDTIGHLPRAVEIAADDAERAALARRFDLMSVDRLEAKLALRREGGAIVAEGRVTAAVVQACSVTHDPVPATIDEPVALRFVEEDAAQDEVELSSEALDTIAYGGGEIDLGEAAAETMALSLDPFPRSPRASETLRTAGVVGEDEVTPVTAFAGLKDLLGRP